MLTKSTLDFLSDLRNNNHKDWFELNKSRYQQAQKEIKSLLRVWIDELGKIDNTIAELDPNKCVFRINRDVRFSKDKSPYKLNLGAYVVAGGKQSNLAGYYLHIEPNNCFFGAGNYMPMPDQLSKIRQEIDYNFDDFSKIIQDKKFVNTFGFLSSENKLKNPPKGYSTDNVALEYLKLKSFTVFAKLKDEDILKQNFATHLIELCKQVQPFVSFLNTAVL
jgi:uncharacterized protein (TIGR02453 family)